MAEEKIQFDDINVGDEAPELSNTLSRTDLVMYAGASGDFNPMHHDDTKATAGGLPSVFGHGMFSMGFLGTALESWAGHGTLAKYRVRFTKQTWPDEELTTKIVVTDKRKESDGNFINVECSLVNQNGEPKVAGDAIIKLS